MSRNDGLEVKKLDDYIKKMVNQYTIEYPKESKKFVREQAKKVKANVKVDTPKVTGNLRKAWKHSVSSRKGKVNGNVYNNAPHAHLVEDGHFNVDGTWNEGKHMLYNTMLKSRPEIDSEFDKFVEDVLEIK